MKKFNEIKKDAIATARGIKKTWDAVVGVGEAIAWGAALGTLYTLIYQSLKGNITLNDFQFAMVSFAAAVLTLRILVEGARYFRTVGEQNK